MQGPVMRIVRSAERAVHRSEGIVSLRAMEIPGLPPVHGTVLACNEERIDPGAGYGRHEHAGTEILTWVAEGELEHEAEDGTRTRLPARSTQTLAAGTGAVHAERNAGTAPLRFVQWHLAAATGQSPQYASALPASGARCIVASGLPGAPATALALRSPAELQAAELAPGERWAVPDAPFALLLVVEGSVLLGGSGLVERMVLEAGDTARLTGAAAAPIEAVGAARVLVLASHAAVAVGYGA